MQHPFVAYSITYGDVICPLDAICTKYAIFPFGTKCSPYGERE